MLYGNDTESMQLIDVLCLRKNPTSENCIVANKDSSEMLSYILSLPLKYRQVIFLYYYEEYDFAVMSDLLGISEGTIRSQLSRARKLLKKKIELEDSHILKGGLYYEKNH